MRLYYIDESEGPRYYVRSALGVDAESWNELFADIYAWRVDLRDRYGIPIARELHASDLLAGRGLLAQNGDTNERVSPRPGGRGLPRRPEPPGRCRKEHRRRRGHQRLPPQAQEQEV